MRDEWLTKESRSNVDRRTTVEMRIDDLVVTLVNAKAIAKEHADDLKFALDVFADAIIDEARR